MTEIIIKNINDYQLNEENVSLLSPSRKEKFERVRGEENKLRTLAAGLLLREHISDKELNLNPYGKPYSENGLFFNLSHSGDYAVLAKSDEGEIGVDIEKVRPENFERLGKIVFCENELNALRTADNQADFFFTIWTRKEAFIKCLGEGFHFPVKSVDLSAPSSTFVFGSEKFLFEEYMLEGYKVMTCVKLK